jgi:hypothetical protein
MMFLFLFLLFLLIAAALWFQGLWSNAVTLINLIVAMLIATNFWEPTCTLIEGVGAASFTYLLDFVVLWFWFVFAFVFLRLITDLLSRTRVKFEMPVEMGGRTLLAMWNAWLVVCFTAFSLQMAPLNSASPLGAWETPNSSSFLFVSPDRLWLRFMQSRSRQALSRGHFSQAPHPVHTNDQDANVETFDPLSEFPIKYRDRRAKYAAESSMRVAR